MTTDDALRLAERRDDRAELVRAMVRAGLGREAVARCGLHVGDVVRRAREPWPDLPRGGTPCPSSGALLRVVGPYVFTFKDPEASQGVATRWLEGGSPGARGPAGCDGLAVLPRTLDLVEPGDGEQVLQPQAVGLQTAST